MRDPTSAIEMDHDEFFGIVLLEAFEPIIDLLMRIVLQQFLVFGFSHDTG